MRKRILLGLAALLLIASLIAFVLWTFDDGLLKIALLALIIAVLLYRPFKVVEGFAPPVPLSTLAKQGKTAELYFEIRETLPMLCHFKDNPALHRQFLQQLQYSLRKAKKARHTHTARFLKQCIDHFKTNGFCLGMPDA